MVWQSWHRPAWAHPRRISMMMVAVGWFVLQEVYMVVPDLASIGIVPLFVRIKGTRVLEDPARAELFGAIRENPGITCNELCNVLERSRSAVVHHLSVIERAGIIDVETFGRCRHHYLASLHLDKKSKCALAALRSDGSRRTFSFIKSHPGAMQQEVAKEMGFHPNQARRILDRLVGAGLIAETQTGRSRRYEVIGAVTEEGALTRQTSGQC